MDERTRLEIEAAIEQALGAQVEIVRMYTGGLSGAPVILAYFTATSACSLAGFHVVKFGKKGWATKERRFYEAHQDGPLSSLLRSRYALHTERVRGLTWPSAVVYTTAFEKVIQTDTLADMVREALSLQSEGVPDAAVRQIERVVRVLLRWNALDQPDSMRDHKGADPWSLLTMMLTPKRTNLLERLRQHLPQWPERDSVIGIYEQARRQAHLLPNALAYFTESAWADTQVRPLYAPGRAHGDLHAGNVLVHADADLDPALIDWGDYNATSLPFYDLAYLEYDLAQRALPPTTPEYREQWWELVSALMRDPGQVNPQLDIAGGRLGKAWALVQPIRRLAKMACQVDGTSWDDFYTATWWLAVVAVGLNFARKGHDGREPLERAAALLYAGRGLECVIQSLGMPAPQPRRQLLFDWKSGSLPEAGDKRSDDRRGIIGREDEINRAAEMLNRRSPVTVIEGPSGIGKGELARVLARQCRERTLDGLRTPFDFVVEADPSLSFLPEQTWKAFVTYVVRELGLRPGSTVKSNLGRIATRLRSRRALFVVDNSVALHNEEVLDWLCHPPEECEVILVTSRRRQVPESENVDPRRITLGGLDHTHVAELAQAYARGLGDVHGRPLEAGEIARLAMVTDGNPRAIKRIVKLAYEPGMSLRTALDYFDRDAPAQGAGMRFDDNGTAVLRDLFETPWRTLSPTAQYTLLALSLFRYPAAREAIRAVSGGGDRALGAALTELINAWLVETLPGQRGEPPRYASAPLVRAFASWKEAELTEWQANDARSRWRDYYDDLLAGKATSAHAKAPTSTLTAVQLRQERHNRLIQEAGNISSLADWLLSQREMADLAILLRRAQNVLFTEGHWDHLVVCAQSVAQWADRQHNATIFRHVLQVAIEVYAHRGDYPQGTRLLRLFDAVVKSHDNAELHADRWLASGRLYSRRSLQYEHPDSAATAATKQAANEIAAAAQQYHNLERWEREAEAYWALGNYYLDTGNASDAGTTFSNISALLRQYPKRFDGAFWDPLLQLGLSRSQLLGPKDDGELRDAYTLLKTIAGEPLGSYHRLAAHLALALCDLRMGDEASARKLLEEASAWKQRLHMTGYLFHEERLLEAHLIGERASSERIRGPAAGN